MKTSNNVTAKILATVFVTTFVTQLAAPQAFAEEPKTATVQDDDKPHNIYEMLFGKKPKLDAVEAASDKVKGVSRTQGDLKARIAAHAKAAGVPADLAEAVVAYESKFNPKARGSQGEVGLMQIKPATARGLGYHGSTAALYDVDTNLTWGMAYLAGAYKLAGGNTCGTILRYNAGLKATRMNRHAADYCSSVQDYVASL
ncbi:lytic transglycosylase domain-containing protein [Oryzibacter oryziterrae]|uniref:lytic transglycosylase domain-containing protein n=1 Tax=Oryzibacter oryziterrae TaxID=2766474 RepID=UPI001F397EF7|nr:lytic transglycosylase domain-containing protein [Oryzibacter oryziterrae]